MAISVMLVEDEEGIRKLLSKIIEKKQNFEIVAESNNLSDAITLFMKKKPEVVFLDIEIKGESGLCKGHSGFRTKDKNYICNRSFGIYVGRF